MVREASRLLAAVTLETFAGREVAAARACDDPDVPSATLDRAIEFIEAHAGEPLTLADLAAAVCVTPRALQLAFRAHLDTTPMAHLRQVRLARIHSELLAADPGSGVTVTEVAGRWGLGGSSRFTSYYREAYGANPNETLAA